MTAEQIADIRLMRGHAIPWIVIAKRLGCSVAECRQALGLPVYADSPTERQRMPWDAVQQTLPFRQ